MMPKIQGMKDGYRAAVGNPVPDLPAPSIAPNQLGGATGATGWGLQALNAETLLVATAPEGTRNHSLNRSAFKLAQLVAGGELPGKLVWDELTAAARGAGLDEGEIRQTLLSALPAGATAPRAAGPAPALDWVEDLPEGKRETPWTNTTSQDSTVLAPGVRSAMADNGDAHATPTGTTTPPTNPGDVPPAMFTRDVALEIHREHVKDAARRHLKAEREAGVTKPRMVGLREFLNEPDEDVQYRVNEVWPTGGRIILAAQYKSGKSTAVGNLIRSLADGAMFLDRYPTIAAKKIVLIDNELDERTLRRWLRDQGIRNVDAVTLIPLRGKISAFDIMDPEVLAQWAAALTGADVVILDCFRPVLDALGLSEDKDAGRFLVQYDALLDQCGASESLIVHHMGHGGERSRGDSRILDWPTATWRMIRQESDDTTSPRYFSAFGRDVEVKEARLEYDPGTRHLSLVGGSRKASVMDALIEKLVEVVGQHRLLPQSRYVGLVHGNAQLVTNALKQAVAEGKLTFTRVGQANLYDIPGMDGQAELLARQDAEGGESE